MDSISTLHARVAALARHRGPDDPDLIECRRRLKQYTNNAEILRARIRKSPPAEWLAPMNEAASV